MIVAVVALVCAAAPVIDEVVDKEGVPGVRAQFDVDADPDLLLQMLWDVSKFKLIFPDIKELVVDERPDDRTVVVTFGIDAVVANVTYTLRRVIDREGRSIAWVSTKGDLKKIVGHWIIQPKDGGGSRVTYQSVVDVGAMPGATTIYRSVVMGKMTEIVGRVQKAAEKLPKQSPTETPKTTPGSTTTQ